MMTPIKMQIYKNFISNENEKRKHNQRRYLGFYRFSKISTLINFIFL